MKASELIKQLEKAALELDCNPEVYFDTEACTFNFHIDKIDRVTWNEDVEDMEDMVILHFSNDSYNH
jgi:hypothetical protein